MDLTADVDSLNSEGNNMCTYSEEFLADVTQLYSVIDGLSAAWQGQDQTAYVNKLNEQKPIMENLGKSIQSCGDYCIEAASILKEAQQSISDAAK